MRAEQRHSVCRSRSTVSTWRSLRPEHPDPVAFIQAREGAPTWTRVSAQGAAAIGGHPILRFKAPTDTTSGSHRYAERARQRTFGIAQDRGGGAGDDAPGLGSGPRLSVLGHSVGS